MDPAEKRTYEITGPRDNIIIINSLKFVYVNEQKNTAIRTIEMLMQKLKLVILSIMLRQTYPESNENESCNIKSFQ